MDTRDKFLAAALRLFADKGFYGASMDQIARELGLTKQALIHHFGTKEKLYGAVLSQISDRLLAVLDAEPGAEGGNAQAFPDVISRIYSHTLARAEDTQLLMRELLDNRRRAEHAGIWYLKPFLDELQRRLLQSPAWQGADPLLAGTHVYQLLGAINYFAISGPTVQQMYSKRHLKALSDAFPDRLRVLAEMGPA